MVESYLFTYITTHLFLELLYEDISLLEMRLNKMTFYACALVYEHIHQYPYGLLHLLPWREVPVLYCKSYA